MSIGIAVIGLGFGVEFVPIYREHPAVGFVAIADPNAVVRDAAGTAFAVDAVFDSLDAALADPRIDAVHIVTGLPDHAEHVIAALEAGKHVACTVPMALSFDDIQRIVDAQGRSRTRYMMMETAVFTREYLFVEALVNSGQMGEIGYARGTHFQDMSEWPLYWRGLPPMFYATHAIAPILQLLNARATRVRAQGGGALRPENQGGYDNPFSVESALIELEGRDTVVELTRSLSQLARPYTESFSIYGDRIGFEWPQREESQRPLLFRLGEASIGLKRPMATELADIVDRADLLPAEIRRFTQKFADTTHRSFVQGGGHGGSHPHLVHEFISSIVEGRAPRVDHVKAANFTATGIAAHQSALAGGASVEVPRFG